MPLFAGSETFLIDTSNASHFLIYGAGGHAKVVIEAAQARRIPPTLVVDDNPTVSELLGVPVVKPERVNWRNPQGFRFIVAVGSNLKRAELFKKLIEQGGQPQEIVHPFSWVSPTVRIGGGTVISAGVVINAEAEIGENCIINTGCSIDHDCRIGAHSHIAPGVRFAGEVVVGERTIVGINSCAIQQIHIGSDTTIGAGSVIVRNIPNGVKAYGNPARVR